MKQTIPVYAARLAPGQQPISFKEIADECDGFDADVEAVNENRKQFWAAVREVIPARDVKALKAAIKARRKRKADRDGEEAYETRVAEILEEIERGTDLATRARAPREDDDGVYLEFPADLPEARWSGAPPPHDPSTGELIEEHRGQAIFNRWMNDVIGEPAVAESAPAEAGQGGGQSLPSPVAPPTNFDMPDIPPQLDRRSKAA